MKNRIIIFLLLSSTLFAQLIEPLPVEVTEQSQMNYQIYQLQKEIDKQFNEDIKNGLEPEVIKIDTKNITVKDNKAIVNIDIYSNTSNKKRVLENQEFVFSKNKLLALEEYPQILEQSIKRNQAPNKNTIGKVKSSVPNRVTSGAVIDIMLSEDVFIPYPLFKHNNGNDIYEIDFELTKDEFGVQLFSAGAEVDGCVFYISYTSDTEYERVAFYIDPDWKRIVYSKEVNGEPGDILTYYGNIIFKRLVAIDVNRNGEIFVLDAEAKAVYKFQYNSQLNYISPFYNSKIIDVNYLNNPSDLSYSDSYSHLMSDDFIVISDIGKKSIMMFDKDGTFMAEYDEYEGNQITKPKRIVAYSNSSSYRLFAFIDDDRIVMANANNYSNLTDVHFSDTFPSNSSLTDIGASANDIGLVDRFVVSDRNQNMLHYFDINSNYICSYKGSGSKYMISPLRVYNTAFAHWGLSGAINLDFYTMDMWSRVRGIKKFVPGADIININVTRGTFKWILNYDETNRQFTTVELKDVVTNQIISTNTNYAYDNELISGRQYMWTIKYTPYYDSYYGEYALGEKSKTIFFTNIQTMPSTISSNYSISGNYIANTNTTINNGATLTIESGASITFENGSSLIVNGTLDVNGTSNNNVLFDFQYQQNPPKNGIKINPSGSADISYAEIRNAYTGIYINEGTATIDNCTIRNGYNGIQLYNTNNSNNGTYITNTRIYEQTIGVDFYYSTNVHLSNNQIDNNYIALNAYSSSPYLAPDDNNSASTGYNWIHTNSFGLIADFNSNPWLGRVSCVTFGGNNTIDGNTTKDVQLNSNCTVYAENNWWGGGPPSYSVGTGSFFDPYPFLNSPPSGNSAINVLPEEEIFNNRFTPQITSSKNSSGPLSLGSIANNDKFGYNENWSIEWKLLYARNLMRVKKYNFAAKICESVITDFPDSARSYLALDLLWQSRKKGKSRQFSAFVKDKVKLKRKKQLYGAAELLISVSEKSKRVSSIADIENRYKDTPLVEHVLFQKFMYYLYEENNLEIAKITSDELGKLFPNSKSYIASQRHLGNSSRIPLQPKLPKKVASEATTERPKTYTLLGNYPNPFNPSTTISYTLPYNSNVELTIYDITGKVIKVFNKYIESAGYQNIVWNGDNQQGSRVSSGIYFYRFKATSIENNSTFEKTAKMLLIK